MQTKANSRHRKALDAVANTFAWATGSDAQAERLEHLDLFHLLGDPLLRLPHPQPVELDVCPTALAGESIDILGTSPIAGACTIELVVRRDRLAFEPPARGQFDPRQMADYAAVYARANEPRLAAARLDRVDGPFSARLNVPAEARGACHVRVFVEGQRGCAVGAADVQLSRPTATR
jgi:diadenosine tetraphosphatase ApaH/serine/threonine PP2A family protein phosphatase